MFEILELLWYIFELFLSICSWITGSSPWRNEAKNLYKTDYVHRRPGTVRGNLKIAHAKDLISPGRRRYSRDTYYRKLTQYKKNLERAKKANDVWYIGSWLYNIGSVLKTSGHMNDALSYYKESLEIFREIEDRKQEACTLGNMGVVSAGMGHTDEALEHFMSALDIHKKIGDRGGTVIDLTNVGLIHKIRGDMLTALKYLKWALNECEMYNLTKHKKTITRAIRNIEEELP